jgi:excisionase family DNA binding protein
MQISTLQTTAEPPANALLRPHAVAKHLGVSERWVRDHATRRFPKLPVVKLGALLRFRKKDVDEFVERQRDDHSGTKRSH